MLRFLQSFFTEQKPKDAAYDDALIDAAMERVISGTDPRLVAVGGYKRKLRPAVEKSVSYVIEVVDRLPPSVELSRKTFGTDALLRTLFVSPQHVHDVLTRSPPVRQFTGAQTVVPDRGHALLGVQRSERTVLGMELQGDAVQREVKQTSVSFSDHQLTEVTGDEDATRWELKKNAFDHLVERALLRIATARSRKDQLKNTRSLLEVKLKRMRQGNWGLEARLKTGEKNDAGAAAPDVDLTTLEGQVADIEEELKTLGSDGASLDKSLQEVTAVLEQPEANLRVDRIRLTLDAMGVKRSEEMEKGVKSLEMDEVFLGENAPRFIIQLVNFSLDESPSGADLLAQAARSLG